MALVFYPSCVTLWANLYSVQSMAGEVFGLFISVVKEESRFSEVTYFCKRHAAQFPSPTEF